MSVPAVRPALALASETPRQRWDWVQLYKSEGPISRTRHLASLRRYEWLLALVIAAAIGIGFLAARFLKPVYVVPPGFNRAPLRTTLGDLLIFGGQSPHARLTHVQVRPGQTTLIGTRPVRDAMTRVLPLDDSGIHARAEVVLKAAPQRNWLLITQPVGVATGIVSTLRTFKVFQSS